jgi:hypothetical protein
MLHIFWSFLLFWYIADTHTTLIVSRLFPRVATRYGESLKYTTTSSLMYIARNSTYVKICTCSVWNMWQWKNMRCIKYTKKTKFILLVCLIYIFFAHLLLLDYRKNRMQPTLNTCHTLTKSSTMWGKHIPKLYINKIICMGTRWRGYVFPSWLPWWGAMGLSLSLFFPCALEDCWWVGKSTLCLRHMRASTKAQHIRRKWNNRQ